jgi:PqqD family protein of HPr-rel-A system
MAALAAGGQVTWSVVDASALRWRQFDPEWVVYDSASGDTSCLDAWSAAVLGMLEARPATPRDLLDQLIADGVIDRSQASTALLDGALQALHQLGLVQTSAA